MQFDNFQQMLWESLSFFAFAAVELGVLFIGISFLVGVINEFLPADKVNKLLSAKRGRGYFIGAFLGALTPFCSCSSIPITVGLLKANAGFGPTMSFLFASPLVNPIIVGLFLTAFGSKITVIYSTIALSMAIVVGYILHKLGFERYVRREVITGGVQSSCDCNEVPVVSPASCCPPEKSVALPMIGQSAPLATDAGITSFPIVDQPALEASCCSDTSANVSSNRWIRILKESVNQFRTFLPYILLGISIGSVFHGFVPRDFIINYAGPDNPLAIPVAAFVGVPLYVRVSTMIPIAISLVGKGMSLGAVIALVIGGAGASIPEVVMLKGIFRLPIIIAFLISVFFIAISGGFILNGMG